MIFLGFKFLYLEAESYSGLIEWESGTLYPTCLSFLQSAAINKNPDSSLKIQLNSALTFIGIFLVNKSELLFFTFHFFMWNEFAFLILVYFNLITINIPILTQRLKSGLASHSNYKFSFYAIFTNSFPILKPIKDSS